jgi:hypothetical protein
MALLTNDTASDVSFVRYLMFHTYQVTVRTWTTGKLSRKENWRRSANSEFRTATHPDLLVFSSSVCGFFLVCQMPFACPLFSFFLTPCGRTGYGVWVSDFLGSNSRQRFQDSSIRMPCFCCDELTIPVPLQACKQAAHHVIHSDEIMAA